MRKWRLTFQDIPSLTIGADARLTKPVFHDDQIWKLSLQGGDPPALALETTFGLRARGFRLFPRFRQNDDVRTDPRHFSVSPTVKYFYPNYISTSLSPFDNIDVGVDYWVPESQAMAGRIRISNQDSLTRSLQIELISVLTPIGDGERMAPIEIQATTILAGKTGDLCPVIFLTGGPVIASGPYPGLLLNFEIPPGGQRHFTWVQAASSATEASFEIAREIASRNWQAEQAKIEMINASQVEILTGDQDWDLALALSQKIALGLFTGPTDRLPYPSFVTNRLPDQGYSIRGDGSDYGSTWNGQSPLQTYMMMNLVLPSEPQLIQNLLENFLATQTKDGFVDWKPGLGGQRSNRLATPLLANLAWQVYEILENPDFIKKNFPALLKFFLLWFSTDHDRDGDGVPELDHPLQASFEDHPIFARWHTWAQGVDITTVESPALGSLLYCESLTLIEMAKLIGARQHLPRLQALSDNLRIAVETTWNPDIASYCYRDRDTHETSSSNAICEQNGNGVFEIHQTYEWPLRILFRIKTRNEATRRPNIFIHGLSASGSHKVERVSLERFQWYPGWGTATSEFTYSSIEQIEVQGIEENDFVEVQSVGLTTQDHTLLSPLWAGIPSSERASKLVRETITSTDLFWHDFGLPACPKPQSLDESSICLNVHIPWNLVIAEGLVDYGYHPEAAELFARLMRAMIKSLKEEGSFFRYYQADTGKGSGERDAVGGLAPVGLFLKILGIKLLSPDKVKLSGINPYPWPVTVKYRGLSILRKSTETQIIFPDGQTINANSPEPQVIALA